ncbi:hypothetical protein Ae201684P_012412 [Aphanomyces euteiches]|nr:hypothetical protein Ae201684P_012412 [Aphanomyces euteiches]
MGDTSLVLRHAFDASGGGMVVSSDFNFRDHELVVVRRSSLHLYKLHDDDTCQLRFKLPASDKEQFLHVHYAEWINAFVVFRQLGAGLHRALLQADGSSLDDLGALSPDDGASLFAVVKHSQLHEFVTADSTGGIRFWALRYSTAAAAMAPSRSKTSPTKSSVAAAALRCPTRLSIQDAKGTQWHALAMDSMHQRVIGASSRGGVKLFDALSGHVLAKFQPDQRHPIRSMAFLPFRDSILVVFSASGASTEEWNVADLNAIHRIHGDGQPAAAIFDQLDGHTVAMSTSVHAFATKLGIDGVVATTKSSQVLVWSACGQILLPLRSVAVAAWMDSSSDAPSFKSSFVFCDFQCAARNWIYVVETNDASCRVSIVELLSPNSSARMLTSSSKLWSLRDVPFNTPPRGVHARRGYMLFGGTTGVKSIQLFEDVALPVCELALTRHEGVVAQQDVAVICFLDYSTLLAKCIVGWSDGVLDLFQLTGQRWRMLKRPSGILADCVCTLQVADGIALVAGDASGSFDSWRVQEDAASDYLGAIQAHAESIVSIQTPCEMCLATISLGGEIKLWTFGRGGWTLAGFFHTLSSNLSVAKLVDAAHICCGTENGAVELWKLPAAMRQGTTTTTLLTAKKPLLYQPQAHRLAVTDVAVFQNVGASIDHDFTLVATMARDQTIVFWYFFGDVFVPFRVVVASVVPCGGFFSTAASSEGPSFLCCLGNSIERLMTFPKRRKQLVELIQTSLHQLHNDDLATLSTTPSVQHTRLTYDDGNGGDKSKMPPSSSLSLYEDLEMPFQLTIPCVVEMHFNTDEASNTPINAGHPFPTTRQYVTMKMGTRRRIEATPVGIQNFIAGQSRSVGGKLDKLHSPRVYRQDRRPAAKKGDGRQLWRPNVVSAFGMHDDDDTAHESDTRTHGAASNSRLQHRRQGLIQPETPIFDAKHVPLHVIDMATRPELNPFAPLFWLDATTAAAASRPTTTVTRNDDAEREKASNKVDMDALVIPWEDLSLEQQWIEVQASLWTKAVQVASMHDRVTLPPTSFKLHEPPTLLSDQIAFHKYTHWYAKKSKARVAFLRQELAYAAQDDVVRTQAQLLGVAIPKSPLLSADWSRFVVWYSRGVVLTRPHHHHLDHAQLAAAMASSPIEDANYAQRLADRTDFLRARLLEIQHALRGFAKLQEKELARQQATIQAAAMLLQRIDKNASQLKPPTLPDDLERLDVDFFEPIALPSGDELDFVPWASLSAVEQQKELALAMHDVFVRWEAIKMHIPLPDDLLLDVDETSDELERRCADFISWWAQPNNPTRVHFLKHEAHEAAKDAKVQAAAKRAGVDMAFHTAIKVFTHATVAGQPQPDARKDVVAYHEWYFKVSHAAESTRVDFLRQRMAHLHREKRLELVVAMGRLPIPMLYADSPSILIATDVDEPKAAAPVVEPPPEEIPPPLDESPPAQESIVAEIELDPVAEAERAAREAREALESCQLVRNRKQMEAEDEAAQAMRLMDDDEDGTTPCGDAVAHVELKLRPPRDYSTSYFFKHMPTNVDANRMATLGWVHGCGLDNGDEEAEERELREQERQRQLQLDALDRARIAEEERLAALKWAEEQLEEERRAQKRAQQLHVKRFLAWQRDELNRREIEATQKRMELEISLMAAEEDAERLRLHRLARERREMSAADEETIQGAQFAKLMEHQTTTRRAADRRQMLREDLRSRQAAEYATQAKLAAATREAFLRDLYTPFQPYFADDATDPKRVLSEKRGQSRRRAKTRQGTSPLYNNYAIPFHQAVTIESPESEIYQAQPSQRFHALLGLPINYRRPPSTPLQNVTNSLETLARSRSVPGLESRGFEGRRAQTSGFEDLQRKGKERRRKKPQRVLAPLNPSNQQQNDAAIFRQSSLPPPFFRGNFSIVGHKPDPNMPSSPAAPPLSLHESTLVGPPTKSREATTTHSEDYHFGRQRE